MAPLHKPGDVILSESPFVHVLLEKKKGEHCDYCVIKSSTLMKCSSCAHMYYCNVVCQKKDWKFHKQECQTYKEHYAKLEEYPTRLLFRTHQFLAKNRANRFKKFPIPNSDRQRCFQELVSHSEKIGDSLRCLHFAGLPKVFEEAGIKHDYDDLFETYCRLTINNVFINHVGIALYIAGSSYNHACKPNAAYDYDGTTFKLRAMRAIQPGEPITFQYIDLLQDTDDRRTELWNGYYFDCQCERCVSRADDDIDYNELNQQIQEADLYLAQKEWGKFSELEPKIVPILQLIYGEYNPKISHFKHYAACAALLSRNFKKAERLGKDAKESIRVTHGTNNSYYETIEDMFSTLEHRGQRR